jgi:spore germination protein YaaH
VLTVPDARARAIRSLAALCRDQHLDGIQFDIENVHVRDKDAFTSFTRESVDSVHHAGCTLSAAVVPRTGGSPAGPVAGYPWMKASLEYVLSLGVPPEKISLGIPAYSDWWYPAYDSIGGSKMRGSDISYPAAQGILAKSGIKPVWDDVQKAPAAAWSEHDVFQYVWMEDSRAFLAKLGLVTNYHLRGYSVWVLGSEDPATWRALK